MKNTTNNKSYDLTNITITDWHYNEINGICNFVQEKCVIDTDSDMRTHLRVLYEAYLTFCDKTSQYKASDKTFEKILRIHFELTPMRWVTKTDGRVYRGYKGVTLKNEK